MSDKTKHEVQDVALYELAEIDYVHGMKYKDIAEKYGVSINTVKSWKTRYKWVKEKSVHTKPKSTHTNKKVCTQKDKKDAEIIKKQAKEQVEQVLSNAELTDKQKLFCLYYAKSFNATQSYLKAFKCGYNVANAEGYKLLVKPCVKEEINRLKALKMQQVVVGEEDMVEFHMRIAFADIGDYMEFGRKKITNKEGQEFEINEVKLNDSKNVDTQLIKEVKMDDKGGVSIKLLDRCGSLKWLEEYFLMNPMDKHKLEYDNRKLAIAESKANNNGDQESEVADILRGVFYGNDRVNS